MRIKKWTSRSRNLPNRHVSGPTRPQFDELRRENVVLRRELDVLRNEMQENIAAINRLEIVTFEQRIQLIRAFGKVFPPMAPCRTKESVKPRGYSFGIITDGQGEEKLTRLVASLRVQNLHPDTYEVMIAGCVENLESWPDVRLFPMSVAAREGRLGAMRNVLSKASGFNKFVSLDDDLLLHPRWSEAVEATEDDFDLATGVILNPDLTRYCDWVNNVNDYTFLRSYQEGFDPCQYLTGGYGIYKDYVFHDHAWRDDLGFYQGEDVTFSRRLFNAGFRLKLIPGAMVMHDDDRYRQKGYGVIRAESQDMSAFCEDPDFNLRLEKLCPRTLS